MELYFVERDIGLSNKAAYLAGYQPANPLLRPDLFLVKLSLDQSVILKSRIVWERLMNLVFFIETGAELEAKVSRRKSKKAAFFDFVHDNPKWRFLAAYEKEISAYDDSFRTPEAHKNSFLRSAFLNGRDIDGNAILTLLNHALNTIWENTLSIMEGRPVTHFSGVHIDASGQIDGKYLPDAS